jgi:hypothetical protein
MKQLVEQPIPSGTEIIEEKPVTPTSRKRFWLLAGLGGGLLAFALIVLVTALRLRATSLQPPMTAEDLAQEKYDAQLAENDVNKAATLQNDPWLLRKEDADTSQQLNSMMSISIFEVHIKPICTLSLWNERPKPVKMRFPGRFATETSLEDFRRVLLENCASKYHARALKVRVWKMV